MTDPIYDLETALSTKIKGISALITELGGTFIYNTLAPQTAPSKYALYRWQAGGDVNDTPVRSVDVLYGIYGIATTKAEAVTISGLIDGSIHHSTLSMSGWNNYWMVREQDIQLAETDEAGNTRWQVGGLYRIRADKTS